MKGSLARNGARVVLVALLREPLDVAVREILAAGGEAWAIAADVGDKRAIHRIAGEGAASRRGHLTKNYDATLGADLRCEC